MSFRVVVTGGSGFIGSNIVRELITAGHQVTVIDDLSTGRKENLDRDRPGEVEVRIGDINDKVLMADVMKGADHVLHQAAIPSVPRSVKDPVTSNQANIDGTLSVLVAARDAGVRSVVFASSSSVYGDTPTLPKHEGMCPNPKSPYAVTKLTGEHYCQVFYENYGLRTICLRYFNVYGPRQNPHSQYAAVVPQFIDKVLRKERPTIYGDGGQTRDFTFVRDVVDANLLAMGSNAQGAFNVSGGKRTSIIDLLNEIERLVNIEVSPVFQPPRPGDIRDSYADISRATKAFGYLPKWKLTEGLKETIGWFQRGGKEIIVERGT